VIALDLFCGGGGAARGILEAGFDEVVGIDIVDHSKAYPGEFIKGDALALGGLDCSEYDFVWASPPCQHASVGALMRGTAGNHVDLIEPTRELLAGHPYTCIENVPNAAIRADVKLQGAMFGLAVVRTRIFELSFPPPYALAPSESKTVSNGDLAMVAGHGTPRGVGNTRFRDLPADLRARWRERNNKQGWCEAMGLPPVMTRREIAEAVPPAYAAFIAREAIAQIRSAS